MALRRALKGDLDAIVLRCLSPRPEGRYTSVAQLLDDLQRHLEGRPILARPPRLSYLTAKAVRRHPLRAAMVAFSFVALLGYGALQARHTHLITRERDAAQVAQEEAEEVTRFLADTFRLADVVYRTTLDPRATETLTVRQALEVGEERVRERFRHLPQARAGLLNALGEIQVNLGNPEAALELLEESLALRRQEQPPAPEAIFETLVNLGNALAQAGRYAEAKELLLTPVDEASPPASPKALRALADATAVLGKVFLHEHKYPEARGRLERALELRGGIDGDPALLETDQLWLAEVKGNLGTALWLLGDLPEAREKLGHALERFEAPFGELPPAAASTLQSLAYVQAIQGEAQPAVESIEKALALRRQAPGPDHPDTLATLSAVGEIYYATGDLEGAERVLREAVEEDRRLKGPDHPDLSLDLHSLASTLLELGRFAEAEPFLLEAIDISHRVWGRESHPGTAHLVTLATLREQQGRHQEEEALLREVLLFRQEAFPADHRLVANARLRLARSLLAQGRLEEVCPTADEVIPIFAAGGHREHVRLAQARYLQGACQADRGEIPEARASLEASYEVLSSQTGLEEEEARRVQELLESLDP
jgi:serine/threonine-protein kinase